MRSSFIRRARLHWVHDLLPAVLPYDYLLVERGEDGCSYTRKDGLKIIVSGAVEQDGRRWIHLSCSRKTRNPSWDDLVQIRDVFIGPHRSAYQVLAPKAKHVNIHPHCLHLWHCPDEEILPDFTRGGSSI